jgi:hypothetical protein
MIKMENSKEVESVPKRREVRASPKLLAIAPLILIGLAAACRGGEGEEQEFPSQTPTIPPSPTATIEAMPSETPQVAVVPATKTPEATPPAQATQTPEATASSTPTPPATPEIVQPKNYTIEIIPPDPTKPSLQEYAKYSEEETQQIIDSLASKYPILGEVKFQIALGGGMGFAGQDQEGKLVIRVDRTDSELKDDLLHELVHSWDFVIKKQANEQLLSLREQILSDPQIGRSYPSLEKIFSGNYTIARMDFQYSTKAFDRESFRVLCSGHANDMWMKSLGFFDQYLFDESWNGKTTPIDSKDPKYADRVTYAHFRDFWQGQADELNRLAQTNSKLAIAINEISSNLGKYQEYAYTLEPKLLGPDRQAAYEWRTLGQLVNLILADKYLNGESGIAETPQEKQHIDRGLETARQAADAEQIAELISKATILTDERRLTFEIPQIDSFIRGVRGLSGN